MASRRYGRKNAFWNNVATGVNGTSTVVELEQGVDSLIIYVTASGATTVTLQTVHGGDATSEGVAPDSPEAVWHDVFYLNTAATLVLAGAGSAALIVPDFPPDYIRLKSSANVTVTAGYEATPTD